MDCAPARATRKKLQKGRLPPCKNRGQKNSKPLFAPLCPEHGKDDPQLSAARVPPSYCFKVQQTKPLRYFFRGVGDRNAPTLFISAESRRRTARYDDKKNRVCRSDLSPHYLTNTKSCCILYLQGDNCSLSVCVQKTF